MVKGKGQKRKRYSQKRCDLCGGPGSGRHWSRCLECRQWVRQLPGKGDHQEGYALVRRLFELRQRAEQRLPLFGANP